jgi:hypothetical protein
MSTSRGLRAVLLSLLMSVIVVLGLATPANATPPNIPAPAAARSELGALTVAPDGSMDGYSREEFPHWVNVEGNCSAREKVLQRDGQGVEVDSACYPTSGSWYVEYNGNTVTEPSDVQIDHVVPLADAWRTGAASWSTDKRQGFANDYADDPQLITSDASSNGSKGDQDPSTWKPTKQDYWCTYASMWVAVKSKWKLTVNSAEKGALTDMLGTC